MVSQAATEASTAPPDILQPKTHFEILDGLRGVAAVAVVVFHFMEFAVPDYTKNFIAHGYLAVDFFFCLSGFVMAYAYDNRMATLGIWPFFKLRLIRLQPLVVIGSVIGLISFVFDPFHNLYGNYGFGKTVMMFITSCLMIPYPIVPERYNNLFHLNPPTWSLFWEYLVNILYALVLVRLSNKILWVLAAVSAVALGWASLHYTQLGVGWAGENFTGGGIRVAYSFIAGMLVYRLQWIIRSSLGFAPLSVLLLFGFLVPFVNGLNQFTDLLLVLFYFPFLIALGAGARLTPRMHSVCKFSGDISYPLYMVHYPFLWLFYSYVEMKKPSMAQMQVMIPVFTVLLIGLAYLIMVYADKPIRRYLKIKMQSAL